MPTVNEGDGDEPRVSLPTETLGWLTGKPHPPLWNAYKCDGCRRVAVTKDIHRGVTPMTMACRVNPAFCKGTMWSMGYPGGGGEPPEGYLDGKPLFHWYRPSQDEFDQLDSDYVKDHIEKGGLLIRKAE